MQEVALHASSETLTAFLAARARVLETSLAAKHSQQLAALRAQLQQGHQNPAEPVRQRIVENILTLHCPRADCGQAFVDFEGCMAVQCARASCKAHYCAIRGADGESSAGAHAHVMQCKFGIRELFTNKVQLQRLQNRARTSKLRELLAPLDRALVGTVLAGLQRDFADVGLRFSVADL